jgi:acetylornithine deacetylase/succinyl-diaminopimelate desuccinylase-like protein
LGSYAELVDRHLDSTYLVSTLSNLARVPTAVPVGFDTLIEPDHPMLVHYVQEVIRPELMKLGAYELIDAGRNNLIVHVGGSSPGPTLLIQNYSVTQHFNTMKDPFSGKVASAIDYGIDERAVFGQGVSQNKSHQTTMLAVLKLIRDSGVKLRGNLYWAVNNEGRSTHECSDAILDTLEQLGTKPDFGVVQLGTGLKISLGNRGRVDVNVHGEGRADHSSRSQDRLSAIDGAAEVVIRLKTLTWPDSHPLLGVRHANVYKIRYEPVAPHTYPSDAYLTVDRRLIPGDDPKVATDEVRKAIGDMSPYKVTVTQGVVMWPALVDESNEFVKRFRRAGVPAFGQPVETRHMQIAFDAGGPCRRGVPTVMYGTASGKGWPIADDFVLVSHVEQEARVLANFVLGEVGVS